MAKLGPVTLVCPLCRTQLHVPTRVVGTGEDGDVLVSMDPTEARKHTASCAGHPAAGQDQGAVRGTRLPVPAHQGQPVPPFVAGGRRACTMCGTTNAQCLAQLVETATPCCGACSEADTHPMPRQDREAH